MNSKRSILTGLSVVFGVALVAIVHEFQSARRAQARLSTLDHERANVEAEIQRLLRAIKEKKLAESGLQRELKAAQSAETPANEASESDSLSPAVRRRILAWADLRYQRLFQKLGLTLGQIENFENLTLNYQMAMHDIAEAAKANGVSPTDPTVAQLLTQETDQFHAEEAELLGVAGFQQLQEDNRTSEPRNWVNGLAGNLYYSEPLSAQQEDNLVQILANLSPGYQSGGNAHTYEITDWNAALSQAQGVLSPAQLEAMKTVQTTYPAGYQAVTEALALQPQGNLPSAQQSTSPTP
jgi:hypothetical protein